MTLKGQDVRRVALRYHRYSTALYGDDPDQIRRQAEDTGRLCEIAGYVEAENGCFVDTDESGNEQTRRRQGKGDRPGLTALERAVARLAPNGPVAVVAWKPDRLFRDTERKEKFYRYLAEFPDVIVHTFQGISNPKNSTDRYVSTLITAGDQYYSDNVREKVARAQQDRLAKGMPAAGWPGFGHTASPDGSWVIVDDEAALIRRAADDMLSGKSLSTVMAEWEEAGATTRRGGQWRLTSLRRILTSPRLAGILTHLGKEVGRGSWEPILDEVTWRRLQIIFEAPERRNGSPQARQLLTGVLICGECGTRLNSNQSKGSRGKSARTYACRACGSCHINAEAVERVYIAKLFERLEDSGFLASLADHDEDISGIVADLTRQQDEMQALKAHADALPVDVYVAKYDAIKGHVDAAQRALDAVASTGDAASWAAQLPRLREDWTSMPMDEKRAAILAVVGMARVMKPAKVGRYASDDEVKMRLQPANGGAFGTSQRPAQ